MMRFVSLFVLLFGAVGLSAQDSVILYVDTTASPSGLIISGETIICPGSITALKVEGKYAAYEWNTGHITPNITVYKPGTYSVTVTTRGGCRLTADVVVRYSADPCL